MDWITEHFDNGRTGWNPTETILTPGNVRRGLRMLFTLPDPAGRPIDGKIYAQPLYASRVDMPGKGRHNVVVAATEGDSVYAFDADVRGPELWHTSLVPAGETTVPTDDVDPEHNVHPQIGITSTPVIDRPSETLYVVAKTKRSDTEYHYRLHALDLTTGVPRPGSPAEISATVSGSGSGQAPAGSGQIPFDPKKHLNRPGLLLDRGTLYLAFSSHADQTPYHGWVLAYDAAALSPLAVFNTSPDTVPGQEGSLGDAGSGGGIWQGGIGPAADDAGSIYFLTGNGPYNADAPPGRDYGDALVKLHRNGTFSVAGVAAPPNRGFLSVKDIDFGSGGAMLLPDQPGVYRDLLVCCGKYALIYLVHRGTFAVLDALLAGRVSVPNAAPGQDPTAQGGIWGGPAFYSGARGAFVYYCLNDDHLKAFRVANGSLSLATIPLRGFNQSDDTFVGGGASPIVSSNGAVDGTAIVWLIRRSVPLTLFAYDASDLTQKLAQIDVGDWGEGGRFIEPTVANGKVFVGGDRQLSVLGL